MLSSETFSIVRYNRYLFMPSVDGLQLPSNPRWMLDNVPSGLVNYPSPVPYLVGMNVEDGTEVRLLEKDSQTDRS